MPSPSQSPSGERRPRAMVIDEAWRRLGPGRALDSLSGPGGAPLTRTVKLIVIPLILRPGLRPELAADFLEPSAAVHLDELIRESGAVLEATAAWFTLLKKTRRALGIVAGNPQDLYFQRCFELASEYGAPAAGAETVARGVVEDIVVVAGGRTVQALKEYLADPERRARLDRELRVAWERRTPLPVTDARPAAQLATEVLDAIGTSTESFESLVKGRHGSVVGEVLWGPAAGLWDRDDIPAHLGLTAQQVPPCPEAGRSASTATLPAPFDRTLFERIFTVLQSSTHRDELPAVPELVRREAGRSCAPLGLYDESLRATVVLGGRLAVGLDPLGGRESGQTAAHRIVNRRWQREASVLRARRMTVSPRPDPDGGELSAIAQDLRTPWVAYMRRLWVRLHGRDVREASLPDATSAWAVLDGVARSVMMDHRARVRAALRGLSETAVRATEPRSA